MREDFYNRLSVITLECPPLRKRRGDIPLFVRGWLTAFCQALGRPLSEISEEAMAIMQAYSWPGNLRELRNVTERILIAASDSPNPVLSTACLPLEIQGLLPKTLHSEQGKEILALPLKEAREIFEKEYLLTQVARFGGNISKTALFVGMERSALHRKLRALQVDSSRKKAV